MPKYRLPWNFPTSVNGILEVGAAKFRNGDIWETADLSEVYYNAQIIYTKSTRFGFRKLTFPIWSRKGNS